MRHISVRVDDELYQKIKANADKDGFKLTVRVIKNGKVEFPNLSDAAPTLEPSNPTLDAKRQLVEKKL